MTNEANQKLTVADVREGDLLQWTNGLGGTETERVFRSRRTGKLAVAGALSAECSVAHLLQIDNGGHIVVEEAHEDIDGETALIMAIERELNGEAQ